MESIFVRALALTGAPDASCVTNASRTPADGTFAVASRHEGVIQVYAASCAALLHEFATIHPRVHALHYTSFSDSLVTLESNRPVGLHEDDDLNSDDEETFLCVYHDWRERDMVRGYTLPLGVLDTPSTKRKADCVAVCSYTGRVVVAMGSVLNMWQCSQGFFEHVMEIKVDMTQSDAYHVLEFVAIHGVYVAFGSSTEVRVMEVHVHSVVEAAGSANPSAQVTVAGEVAFAHRQVEQHDEATIVPEDDFSYVHFDTQGDTSVFDSIPIPLASYGEVADESDYLHLHEKSANGESEEAPVVLDRNEAQQEELNLAGLIKMQDIRVNQAMNYYLSEGDVRIILRRYLPPNQRVQTLKFLPETIDNHVSLEARSYTRLLVCTVDHAFLYYFLSSEADVTRKRMVKKVLGKGDFKRQSSLSTRSSPTSAGRGEDAGAPFSTFSTDAESGRVVMHYAFSSPVTCITANSSFLFVTTSSSLQVWSIWSPCHHLAATRTLNSLVHHEPTQPQLISVEALDHAVCDIAALDAYVVVVPREEGTQAFDARDLVRTASAAAVEVLPPSELELRGAVTRHLDPKLSAPRSMLIIQQSPPSAIFSLLQSKQDIRSQTRVDLLLSVYSLYRYRADVGANALAEANEMLHSKSRMEAREAMAMELETRLYDRLACDCATALATEFIRPEMRDLPRAALFFVESKVPPSQVLERFQKLGESETAYREQAVQATHKYLEARVFQTGDSSGRRLHSARLPGGVADPSFTQSVVSHYVKHTPEKLPRLLIDSCVVWTLADLHFGFETLKAVQVRDASLVNIAHLVMTLRAQSVPPAQWASCRETQPTVYEAMQRVCSYEALCASVDTVAREDAAALTRLCVGHPDLLINGVTGEAASTASSLSQALLLRSPLLLAQVLEAVFDSAISRRESILGSVILCVKAIGKPVRTSLERITSQKRTSSAMGTTGTGHFILLRFLCFVLDAFPRLCALAEKDELSEDDEELLATRRQLAMEVLHMCVDFVSTAQGDAALDADLEALESILSSSILTEATVGANLPDWELLYLETWCMPKNAEALAPATRYLLKRALGLLHEPKLLDVPDVLSAYERSPANDFAVLLVLLALPQTNRTVDGLRLLAKRETFVELFLPYGTCYCSTLEEWKFLIETLSSLSEGKTESLEAHRADELEVLESVLSHVCATLGPEDLLEVLPDDGDLAMFIATIEASVRLQDARTREASGVAVR